MIRHMNQSGMTCERCGQEGAEFTGSSKEWGPDESDCQNTVENLPGGYGWLCQTCDETLHDVRMKAMGWGIKHPAYLSLAIANADSYVRYGKQTPVPFVSPDLYDLVMREKGLARRKGNARSVLQGLWDANSELPDKPEFPVYYDAQGREHQEF